MRVTIGTNCVQNEGKTRLFVGEASRVLKAPTDRLGFVWDLNEHAFQKFYDALEEYALRDRSNSSGKRHLRVPTEFIVPHGKESGWPEELWGYPLGAKCSEVRRKEMYVKHYPRRKKALERLGFSWSGNATLGWLDVVHAAATYSQINGGKLDVPFKFVVPSPPHYTSSGEVSGRSDPWPWPGE
eukprot:CAMPEP_0118703260 /NCGR_PEP_ID=MMETSP0800-20121206/18430_1 /TAXON_ID=210618 ORGANISM="Striatella unipunctata, Strain CCMP2910" /NCGR_SAMPLE_ID=MMETSP0800 /ASSEMBLY_ACC=CAM_ASM_000638 /LENGTH=183 /DNA_ID=CAMNT_0006604717 /DNA_START=378 /DNA_END=930 /DNA_ORIENTATION=+